MTRLSEDAMRRRVADARVGRLATLDPDGRLGQVPICYVLESDTLYTAVDAKPKTTRRLARLDAIRAHPDVAVLVDHFDEDWSQLWWVRIRGRARIVEAGAESDSAVAALVDKYWQYRDAPPAGPVIAITIDEWTGWAAST